MPQIVLGTVRAEANRPVDSLFTLAWLFDQCGQAKVAHFDVHVPVEKEIAELEVSVDDLVGVHIVASPDDLDEEKTCFGFGVSFSTTEHVHHAACFAEFEGHVHVFVVFEAFFESDNVGMLECAVEFDFCV